MIWKGTRFFTFTQIRAWKTKQRNIYQTILSIVFTAFTAPDTLYLLTVYPTEQRNFCLTILSIVFILCSPCLTPYASRSRQQCKPFEIRMRYSAWRIPPTRESSSAEAEFAISRTSFPFRITRSGWKTGDASGDTAGSLISAKDTDCWTADNCPVPVTASRDGFWDAS